MSEASNHVKVSHDGQRYAGEHLLVELWGAAGLTDVAMVREAMESSAAAAGAHLLHSHYHQFGEGGGVSGVSVLAESHITIHTWPELDYAAIDIFMCGACNPLDCLDTIKLQLKPREIETQTIRRGFLREPQIST